MFFASIKKYFNNIKNLPLWNKKKNYKIVLSGTETIFFNDTFSFPKIILVQLAYSFSSINEG